MRFRSLFRAALVILTIAITSVTSFAQVGIGISVSFAPPALPIYVQPPSPAPGYIWTPGYWAYDPYFGDYYWVPGTWVLAPVVGYLWTPGYWAWNGAAFFFHEGYWGPRVGFYGGINYGFGYFGEGYQGGRWDHGQFYYNRTVNNVNITNIHNVYNTTVINNTTVNRVSYNGGEGGITARATPEDEAAARERHVGPVTAQTQHVEAARANPQLRASVNQGKPPIAATEKPGSFHGSSVVAAERAGAQYHPPANRTTNRASGNASAAPREGEARTAVVHAKDLPPHPQPTAPNTGNAKLDQKYQKQQQKLNAQQEKEHQTLAQQQEKDHQRAAQQHANEARTQEMEQKHQQQTQQMEQRHAEQQQHLQARQTPSPAHGQAKSAAK